MRKPGTDPSNVRMSDVLCDFCSGEWTPEEPMLEGHRGSCICGRCLTVGYSEVVVNGLNTAPADYACTMCLEREEDRQALGRGGEPGWQSPAHPESVICRRCLKLAAGALHKDEDFDWRKPQ